MIDAADAALFVATEEQRRQLVRTIRADNADLSIAIAECDPGSSLNIRSRTGVPSGSGNSLDSSAGSQKRRNRFPIGVPGPTRVNKLNPSSCMVLPPKIRAGLSKFSAQRLRASRKCLFQQRVLRRGLGFVGTLGEPCRQNEAADNAFTGYCGSSQNTIPVSGRPGGGAARLPLSCPVTSKITLSQDIRELGGELSGPPPRREDQMQVRQQRWGIDRKLDEKIVTNEGLRAGNEATGNDAPLRSRAR